MRIGILVDTLNLRGWRRAVAQRLLQARDISIERLIVREAPAHKESALWRAIDALERAVAKRVLHRPLARSRGVDPAILDDRPSDLAKFCDAPRVSATELDAIRAANLDVIIDLFTGGDFDFTLARRGVWRLAAGEGASGRLSPLGFWEFYRNAPVTEISVLARDSDGERQIAVGSYSGFMWSWSLNDLLLGARAAAMLEDALRSNAVPRAFAPQGPTRRRIFQAPLALLRTYIRLATDALERAFAGDRWHVLISRGDPLAPGSAAPTIIEPPAHSYWADPFVVMRDGRCHLFFEEYLYAERRGVIAHVCIDELKPGETLRGLNSTMIIDQPHHLSYPFIFELNGELFMIPESSGAKVVEIWKATNFPHGWTRVATPLANIAAADTSLLEHNGRWWLFTNIDRAGVGDHRSELHVFHAFDPIAGPWTPHAANPVVTDARCGRMAGGFLRAADGRPIRCGQVQGRKYGERVSYRLITELTETTYAEEPIANIDPIPVAPGARTHHVAARDGLIVVDECFVVPKWRR